MIAGSTSTIIEKYEGPDNSVVNRESYYGMRATGRETLGAYLRENSNEVLKKECQI